MALSHCIFVETRDMKESISVSPRARIRVNHLVSQIVLPNHNLKFLDLVVQHVAAHFLVAFTIQTDVDVERPPHCVECPYSCGEALLYCHNSSR